MQINPLLMSLAVPAAARSVRAVAHAAHQVGQSFMTTFTDVAAAPTEHAEKAGQNLHASLQAVADGLRDWFRQQGVAGEYSLKFHVDAAGEPVANVVGRDSAKIAELLYEGPGEWLEQLSQLAQQASSQLSVGGERVELALSDHDARFAPRTDLLLADMPVRS